MLHCVLQRLHCVSWVSVVLDDVQLSIAPIEPFRGSNSFVRLFVCLFVCLFTLCRNKETEILKGQIDFLNDAITKEEERAAELEMKSK